MRQTEWWEYRNPVRIVFGRGRLSELTTLAYGRTLLITTAGASRRGVAGRVVELLGPDRTVIYDEVNSNPTVDRVDDAINALRSEAVDTIVAVGGGSTIDVGKVLSLGLADTRLVLRDALAGADLTKTPPLNFVAVPTTAGTGSEATPFATLWDAESHRKLSFATPNLHPSVALLDPELTLSLSWEETLGPGLDAYAQCFEAIWNRRATPITTSLAQRGLELAAPALNRLRADPSAIAARSDMLEAALLSGLSISQTRTALAHSMSYPITARFGLPHGLACALVLPAVMAFNVETDDGRLASVARRLGLDDADTLVATTVDLLRSLGAPEAIRNYIPDTSVIATLADEMLSSERADNNVRPVDADAIQRILSATEAWISPGPLP
jgi:alcohol dehydrogenase